MNDTELNDQGILDGSDSERVGVDDRRLVRRWEKRIAKLKSKKKKTKSLRYEVLYQGKIDQLAECVAELKQESFKTNGPATGTGEAG